MSPITGSGTGRSGRERRVEGRLPSLQRRGLRCLPQVPPKTVSTDGWKGTQAAWKVLFTKVVILLCFLHGWLKIRDRAKHLKEVFAEVSRRVWDTYHVRPPEFCTTPASLRQWAAGHLTGIVLEKVLDLCGKRDRWSIAYRHPGGHRTSNMLDRLMRGMNRYFDQGQHVHGSLEACPLHCRAWALLCNFTPWHPAVAGENQGWRCPAERLTSTGTRLLAAKSIDLRIAWGIPTSNPPKSVTVSQFYRVRSPL